MMAMTRPKVELFTAFVFTCDDCGRDTFVRSAVFEPGSIDIDGLRESEEIKEWIAEGGSGEFCTAPVRVACSHCCAKFDVEDAGDGD